MMFGAQDLRSTYSEYVESRFRGNPPVLPPMIAFPHSSQFVPIMWLSWAASNAKSPRSGPYTRTEYRFRALSPVTPVRPLSHVNFVPRVSGANRLPRE